MTRRPQATEITVRQDEFDGWWYAEATVNGKRFRARGDSSIQAHARLLEKVAA